MSSLGKVSRSLTDRGWFNHGCQNVHCIVDGQYGSTGKGVAASLLEHAFNEVHPEARLITSTNSGPNSGHTAIYQGIRIMTRQITISATQRIVVRSKPATIYLNAGAVIDPPILRGEASSFGIKYHPSLIIHGNAAVILPQHIAAEGSGSGPSRIAGTAKGVGAALAAKIMRTGNIANLLGTEDAPWQAAVSGMGGSFELPHILETAQGFSLGVNQRFYPHCTSRECTVMQALSDACIHPAHLNKTLMVVRTFPIRVGSTPGGYSGDCYMDQQETTWEQIGVEPEYTTVTKRMRRVFTWSRRQFQDAVVANRPDAIFLNFVNYLKTDEVKFFIRTLLNDYEAAMMRHPDALILGMGPNTEDCVLWQQ